MIGGLGVQELLIVFVIALVLFGGKKLPEVGQNLGKALRSFKSGEAAVRREMQEAMKEPAAPEEKEEKIGPKNEEQSEETPEKKNGVGKTAENAGENG